MKILVTGGAGFIGSHIVDALIMKGHQVAVVDDLSTGFEHNLNPKARFYHMSINDRNLSDIFDREKPDIVNHHAAQMIIARSVRDPVFDASENIIGGLNVILNCIRFKVKKMIYASSGGAVYGEPQYLPVDEKHPINPISQYGVSKHVVEHYLYLYYKLEGLDYTVLRYSNVYGPRQNPTGEAGVVAIFASQILRNEQLTIFGDGSKTRDYTFISDIIEANMLALSRGSRTICNIGTGVATSDKMMFDALSKIFGYKREPIFAPFRKGEVTHIYLNNSLAQNELGWKQRFNLEEGLVKSADYYRQINVE